MCFETSSDDLASLSVIERYDRFLQRENADDVDDSDADDFFPDDTMLRREYARLRSDTTLNNHRRITNNRLSGGLPAKYINNHDTSIVSVTDDDTLNGSIDVGGGKEAGDAPIRPETALIELGKLLHKLEEVRKCGAEEGNSIFCTEEELHAIQERYAAILDFIYALRPTFEKANNCKDSDSDEPQELENDHEDEDDDGDDDDENDIRPNDENNGCTTTTVAPPQQPNQSQEMQLLERKMESVARARDRFFEIEQQVREQIEQLELVERYKMEIVS